MKNFVQDGKTCTFTAPAAVASGAGFLVGSLFAIASADAANGAKVEGVTVGVFTLPKVSGAGTDFTAGTKLYWDNAAKNVTKTAAGNTLIGVALADALAGDTSATVRLNGTA